MRKSFRRTANCTIAINTPIGRLCLQLIVLEGGSHMKRQNGLEYAFVTHRHWPEVRVGGGYSLTFFKYDRHKDFCETSPHGNPHYVTSSINVAISHKDTKLD